MALRAVEFGDGAVWEQPDLIWDQAPAEAEETSWPACECTLHTAGMFEFFLGAQRFYQGVDTNAEWHLGHVPKLAQQFGCIVKPDTGTAWTLDPIVIV